MDTGVEVPWVARLAEIGDRIEQLFALVTEGLAAATEALLSGDREVVRVLVERDGAVDSVYRSVEDLVEVAISSGQAGPADARLLLVALRIAPELERSHDLVEHIARRGALGLTAEVTPRARGLVARMGALGVDMWRLSSDVWSTRDPAVALTLAECDDELDEMHAALSAEVALGVATVPVAMEMALVARFFERLGDHAVNVARRAVTLPPPSGPPVG